MSQDSAGLQQTDDMLAAQNQLNWEQSEADADMNEAARDRIQDLQGHGTTGLSPASDDPDRNLVDPDIMVDRDRAPGDSGL